MVVVDLSTNPGFADESHEEPLSVDDVQAQF
jgi:hypothetical protein